ncbi:MAG: c-type cytochrome, partial [Pseudomonadota bacterium]
MRQVSVMALGGLLLAGGLSGLAVAGDPAAGRKIANMCQTCHGVDGFARVPIAPHIGGEPLEYLEAQLMAYKTGQREHEMMSVVTASLSAQQISDVAAWYASHTAVATLPEG